MHHYRIDILLYNIRDSIVKYIKGWLVLLVLCLIIFPYIKSPIKSTVNYPIEIIESVQQDTTFGKKYAVKIKRIELVENSYILHTGDKYNVNDTIHPVW